MSEDRRTDEATRERLTQIIEDLEGANARLEKATASLEEGRRQNHRAIVWLTRGFIILIVGVTVIGWRVVALSRENSERVDDVVQSRADAVRISCEDQNEHHDNTLKTLDRLLTLTKKTHPERAKQAEESRTGTVLLLEAIVPHRNCEARVLKLVPESAK